jgi:hypothetical protein
MLALKDSSKNQPLASLIPGVMHPTQKKLALAGLIPGIMLSGGSLKSNLKELAGFLSKYYPRKLAAGCSKQPELASC